MKPLTVGELKAFSACMAKAEYDIRCSYTNRSGKFAIAKLIDVDDERAVVELRNGVQDDCTNLVHTDILVLSRKHPGVILHWFEEESLRVFETHEPDLEIAM